MATTGAPLNITLMSLDGEITPNAEQKFNDAVIAINTGVAGVSTLKPRAHAYNNSNQPATTAVELPLALTAELYDTDVIHDNSTNNSRLTCKTAGDYRISGAASFAANVTGGRYIVIKMGGTNKQFTVANAVAGGVLGTTINVGYTMTLAVNDYIQLFAYQDSGITLNVTSCYLAMEKLG